nr:(Fe-S)-binding protein [Candidatus Freyarchaeota archaeon]
MVAKRNQYSFFNEEACIRCGECFSRCPVMKLPIEEAKGEIQRLIDGEETTHVLKECESCFACNYFCPKNCYPTELILQRWYEEYKEKGLPERARWYIAHEKPNFRTYTIERLPDDEKKTVESWSNFKKSETILYPGCNVLTIPSLTYTSLLDEFLIMGSLDVCCGETYYRTGMFDRAKQSGKRLEKWFKSIGAKKVVTMCTACYNITTNILPKRFGVKFNFEIIPFYKILLENLENGTIKVKKKLNKTVTIQDPCHAKALGEEYLDMPRRILETIGAKVVEMECTRECSLCCGISGGFSFTRSYNPWNLTKATIRRLRQAPKTHADILGVYCAGCLQMLSVGKKVWPTRIPIYSISELVQMTIGEKPAHRCSQRASTIFKGVILHQFPKTLSWKRFWLDEIKPDF